MKRSSYQDNNQAKDEQYMIDTVVKIMRESQKNIRAIYYIALGLSQNNIKNKHK